MALPVPPADDRRSCFAAKNVRDSDAAYADAHTSQHRDCPSAGDYRKAKPQGAPPLRYVATKVHGVVRYFITPKEVDKAIQDTWKPIRDGDARDHQTIIRAFKDKYAEIVELTLPSFSFEGCV